MMQRLLMILSLVFAALSVGMFVGLLVLACERGLTLLVAGVFLTGGTAWLFLALKFRITLREYQRWARLLRK